MEYFCAITVQASRLDGSSAFVTYTGTFSASEPSSLGYIGGEPYDTAEKLYNHCFVRAMSRLFDIPPEHRAPDSLAVVMWVCQPNELETTY